MIKKHIFTFIAAMAIVADCFAWGQVGHDTTCNIAERHLTKKAKKKISKILDGKSIVYWSNWLDNACHHPEYAYASTWHYKNVDEGQKYDDVAPFEKGDIITALTEQVEKLKSHSLSKDEEALAIKMLIHFMGDIHQPMHLAHKSDLGGNKVNVKFFTTSTNLHHVWDEDLVERGHHWTYDEWTDQIDRADKQQVREILKGTFDDWAKESLEYATKIYATAPEGTKMSYDYVAEWTPVVEERLLYGGLRLANILNEIYK